MATTTALRTPVTAPVEAPVQLPRTLTESRQITSVAIVSVVDPYPTDSGKKVVLDGFLSFLADRLGAENVHYLLVGGRAADVTAEFPVTLHELAGAPMREKLASVFTRCTTGRSSVQEALTRSATVQREINEKLAELGVDMEVYDTVRLGQYADPTSTARQVCYLDDLFSERYRMMLDWMDRHPEQDMQALGTFAEHVPAKLRKIVDLPVAKRALLAFEQRMIRRSEIRAARRFDRCLLVNDREAGVLNDRADTADQVVAVPPMVSVDATTERDYAGAPEFVFLGLLSQPWNEDGLRSFTSEVWPELLRRRPDATLRVIGRQAPQWLLDLAAEQPENVLVEGYVADLDGALASAAAMLNPARFGTGVKIKVIEALGRSLPVVGTPLGADGVESGPGTGVLTPETVEETVTELLRLTDVEENRLESKAAGMHFARRYRREAAFASYAQAFGFEG
jgi:Glycosyl transferases group 1